MAELLLEIGLEEIPARMIAAAQAELATRVRELVTRERLVDGALTVRSYSTPRRLAVHVAGLAAAQADTEESLTGPAWSIAFKDGAPGPAAQAFAKKAGVAIELLEKVTTPKGDYVSAVVHRAGRATAEVLATELPKEIGVLAWPKNMYWRAGKPERYVRPVKWLLALLDHSILPVSFAGVHAGNLTYGHRILHGAHAVTINHPGEYLSALHGAKVMADVAARRHMIRKALDHATRTVTNARWREDEPLIETVVHLTEWPSVVLGSFEPEYLSLPEEVLVTVMRDHQKYFAVEDAEGKLAPHFLAVLNTEPDAAGVIRHGNERVLRARFNDARFFWNFDQKISMVDRVELLKSVTFQKDLGNYYEKTERTASIAQALLLLVPESLVDGNALSQAVRLAKADLTTELVKEFTELQGIVGGLYARAAGENEKVVAAIYSQYQPSAITDPIPSTVEGQLLGLADRIGTIVDMFALGFAPTGSKDPYALRRAANAIVSILAQSRLSIRLSSLIQAGLADARTSETSKWETSVAAFFRERVEFYLREVAGVSFDAVNAVVAAQVDDVADTVARAQALEKVRSTDDFRAISAAFKRSKNILRQGAEKQLLPPGATVDPSLLSDTAEQSLHAAARQLIPDVEALRAKRNYAAALERIATLRPHVDLFFERVMVMVEDEATRTNRLALLALVVSEFSKIADFSEIVPAGA
jgi:glycyl-tRNA synthetase beta chain